MVCPPTPAVRYIKHQKSLFYNVYRLFRTLVPYIPFVLAGMRVRTPTIIQIIY